MRFRHRILGLLCFIAPLYVTAQAPAQLSAPESTRTTPPQVVSIPGNFVDITAKSHVAFNGQASHTVKKYLLETMGSGVALFDYDNDGLPDLEAPKKRSVQFAASIQNKCAYVAYHLTLKVTFPM